MWLNYIKLTVLVASKRNPSTVFSCENTQSQSNQMWNKSGLTIEMNYDRVCFSLIYLFISDTELAKQAFNLETSGSEVSVMF